MLLQVSRSLKRAEAVQKASMTGELRVVLGATGWGGSNGNGDFGDPRHDGWLVLDVNALDVSEPSDFA